MTLRLGVTLAVLCLGTSGAYAEEATSITDRTRSCDEANKAAQHFTVDHDLTALGPGTNASSVVVCNCSETKGKAHPLTPEGLPVNKDAPIDIEKRICLPFNGINGLQLLRSGTSADWKAAVIYR